MPGIYQAGDFDLAGFCVGIVEKDSVIDGSRVSAGNRLIALAPSDVGYYAVSYWNNADLTAEVFGEHEDGPSGDE